jgi:hypothetical protein
MARGPCSVTIVHSVMGSRANRRSIKQSFELRKWGVNSLKPGDREREREEKRESPFTLQTAVRHILYRHQRRKFLSKDVSISH